MTTDRAQPIAVDVRRARPEEYEAVGETTVRAYAADGYLSDGDDYANRLRDAAHRAANAELWVASQGPQLLGTVTFCPPGSAYRELAGPSEGEFRMLAVDPPARGHGVAGALVDKCFARCIDLGLTSLVICSQPGMTPAHALYRSRGFVRDARLDWHPVPEIELLGFRAPVRCPATERACAT